MTICAGSLAQRYAELGGKVFYCGKPQLPIYRECFTRLKLMPSSVLAIGDSLMTDVAGANFAGLDVAWVTNGIHLEELNLKWTQNACPEAAESLLEAWGHYPTFVTSRFML